MKFEVNGKLFTVKKATLNDLDRFYSNSSLTLFGLSKESIKDWMEYMSDFIVTDKVAIYTYSGKMMNDKYSLRGNVAYPDDLTNFSFDTNLVFGGNIGEVAIDRFNYGGRWFDDIVDNNEAHMSEMDENN